MPSHYSPTIFFIKYKTSKTVAQTARSPQFFGFSICQLSLCCLSWLALASPTQAQIVTSPPNAASSQSNAAANSSGSTVNQQVNNQINQSSSYGLGSGINCPVPTVGLSLFGSAGSGSTNGSDPFGGVDAKNIGAAVSYTMPVGNSSLHDSCEQIGKFQVQLLQTQISELESRVEKNRIEAYKTKIDVDLVVLLKCIELKRNAQLLNESARMCADIIPVGQVPQPATPDPTPPTSIAPPKEQLSVALVTPQQYLVPESTIKKPNLTPPKSIAPPREQFSVASANPQQYLAPKFAIKKPDLTPPSSIAPPREQFSVALANPQQYLAPKSTIKKPDLTPPPSTATPREQLSVALAIPQQHLAPKPE